MSRGQFRVLSLLGTICRVTGWIFVVLAVVAAVTVVVTSSGMQEVLRGAGVFLGSLAGGLILLAQGQLIKAILAIERNTRP